MPKIERSALVNHSAEQMFDLVNDIESYPEFMHGCRAAKVISQSDEELVGELTLGQPGIQQTFTTRNQLSRPDSIEMKLVSGQFKSFTAKPMRQFLTYWVTVHAVYATWSNSLFHVCSHHTQLPPFLGRKWVKICYILIALIKYSFVSRYIF